VFGISAISGAGCKELTYAIMAHIEEAKRDALEADATAGEFKETGLINESMATNKVSVKDQ
jgi:GTP-binding protein